jgi:hypothetical protein
VCITIKAMVYVVGQALSLPGNLVVVCFPDKEGKGLIDL